MVPLFYYNFNGVVCYIRYDWCSSIASINVCGSYDHVMAGPCDAFEVSSMKKSEYFMATYKVSSKQYKKSLSCNGEMYLGPIQVAPR